MEQVALPFNFSTFFYFMLRGNVPGKTNPDIIYVLTDQNLPENQFPDSSCAFFISGQRKFPKVTLQKLLEKHPEQLSELFRQLEVQNTTERLNIFTAVLENDQMRLDSHIREKLLHLLHSETDPFLCLSYLYHQALMDTQRPVKLTKEQICFMDALIIDYTDHDRLSIVNPIHADISSDSVGYCKFPIPSEVSSDSNEENKLPIICIASDTSKDLDTEDQFRQSSVVSSGNADQECIQEYPSSRFSVNFTDIFASSAAALNSRINCQQNSDSNPLYGWCRNLEQPDKVGVWATADGLCIAALSGCLEPLYLQKRTSIIEGLWKRRYPEGGFSNENQSFPSIETTCIVIEAFLKEREFQKAQTAFDDLQKLWNTHRDSQYDGGISVIYLSQLLDIYVRFHADAAALMDIEQEILKQAVRDPDSGELLYWKPPAVRISSGTAVHTAMAVRALLLSASARGCKTEMMQRLSPSAQWLVSTEWSDFGEMTYRKCTSTSGTVLTDQTFYEHFAAPWCIMALLKMGYSRQHPRITEELQRLITSQQEGLWYHGSSPFPQIWVTHDVLQCLYEYAFR